jgi:hypothetical protein
MYIWIVMVNDVIIGAFKNKEDAYNCIVKDFTRSNRPDENSYDYYSNKKWFNMYLAELKKEYENSPDFGCAEMWRAERVYLE